LTTSCRQKESLGWDFLTESDPPPPFEKIQDPSLELDPLEKGILDPRLSWIVIRC
jgi:hypothetical protein